MSSQIKEPHLSRSGEATIISLFIECARTPIFQELSCSDEATISTSEYWMVAAQHQVYGFMGLNSKIETHQ
jgi:hypothetical protein